LHDPLGLIEDKPDNQKIEDKAEKRGDIAIGLNNAALDKVIRSCNCPQSRMGSKYGISAQQIRDLPYSLYRALWDDI
jgi:hypothetical protein